jgi:23S rRNA (cytosine1962-C5)-methyltransferase
MPSGTASAEAIVVIRPDRVDMFEKRHPWVFSGAVQRVDGAPADGDIVTLRDGRGNFLARGYWNRRSQIHVHVLTWQDEPIEADFWAGRLRRALAARAAEEARRAVEGQIAYRLVNAESDGLPGLVVDRYRDWLVLQALTVGIDCRKAEIAAALLEIVPGVRGVYERSDVDVREKEGLPPATGLLAGEPPPSLIAFRENGYTLQADVRAGHKTGFYLDQRPNRAAVAEALRSDPTLHGATVLNCFSYTGGFGVAALTVGAAARTLNLDSSADALELAKQNYALNGLPVHDDDFVVGDVFHVLRQYRTAGRTFDCIVLDPPKFAHNQKQVESACRGYKDINLLAFQLLRPGGLLATFSCSGLVSPDLFQKVVFGALIDARREGQIIGRLTAGPDHPVALTFPEGLYLKGLLCRVW